MKYIMILWKYSHWKGSRDHNVTDTTWTSWSHANKLVIFITPFWKIHFKPMLHNVAKSWSLDQHYWIIQRTSCNEMIFFFFITIISCLTCIVNLSLLKYIWGKSEVWLSRSGDDIGDENYTEEDNDAVCKPYYPCSPRAAVFSAGGHMSPWVSNCPCCFC